MTTTTQVSRPTLEVADVLRQHGAHFLQRYGCHLSSAQERVLHELAVCRTAALGGHVEECLDCGQRRPAYNSCRNRHCPKCQGAARAAWLEREAAYLLPVEYHHVVFTLPAALGPVALQNARVLYGLLFQTAWQTIQEVASDPHYLGAEVGLLAVLHTWGQNLCHHPHLHCVVSGGGLSCAVAGDVGATPHWVACRPGFFLPVRVLSRLFRGKFLAGLAQAYTAGRLQFHGQQARLSDAATFTAWLTPLYQSEWVVYAKPPWGGPGQVLKYLARYTHRVAISNSRLVSLADGRVTFRYKDYADDAHQKEMTLEADEFIRRLLLHVLPRGFVKIRHYGLLANRYREAKLKQARQLLQLVTVAALLQGVLGVGCADETQPDRCPHCGGQRWRKIEQRPRPSVAEVCLLPLTPDTS